MRKSLLEAVHETLKDFYEVGIVDQSTLRQFDILCLSNIEELTSGELKTSGISQYLIHKPRNP